MQISAFYLKWCKKSTARCEKNFNLALTFLFIVVTSRQFSCKTPQGNLIKLRIVERHVPKSLTVFLYNVIYMHLA